MSLHRLHRLLRLLKMQFNTGACCIWTQNHAGSHARRYAASQHLCPSACLCSMAGCFWRMSSNFCRDRSALAASDRCTLVHGCASRHALVWPLPHACTHVGGDTRRIWRLAQAIRCMPAASSTQSQADSLASSAMSSFVGLSLKSTASKLSGVCSVV